MKRKLCFALAVIMAAGIMLAGCGTKEDTTISEPQAPVQEENVNDGTSNDNNTVVPENANTTDEEPVTIKIGAMSGPTAMGMVKLMNDSEEGLTENTYDFAELATDATALVPAIAKGELDIAAVPSNLAANVFNQTEGGVKVVAACVQGVLNLVERGETITSIADLKGESIYATGQGAVPEYIIRYVLEANGINPDEDVNIIWCSDTTEAMAYVTEVKDAIAILPQPFVTALSAKIANDTSRKEDEPVLRVVMDLNDAWADLDAGCEIITGVIVARTEFAEKYPEQLAKFLDEYAASVAYTSENVDETATLIVKYGIVGAEGVAKKALPNCHIICYRDQEMRDALEGFLQVIFDMNPKAVGGAMPTDDFYYIQ